MPVSRRFAATTNRRSSAAASRGRRSRTGSRASAAQIGYEAVAAADLSSRRFSRDGAQETGVCRDRCRREAGRRAGTNTSTLDIDDIAAATQRPESVVGLHFFSPAHVMRLVEIVRGRATSTEVLATALAFAKRLGKVGVVVRNGPGFVGNRMMFPYMYEAQFLVEEGATPGAGRSACSRDWGMAMGIFAVDDLGGLDVRGASGSELNQFAEPELRKPLVADTLVEMKRLGQKTGKGWYRYEAAIARRFRIPEVLEHHRTRRLLRPVSRAAPISDEEILERCSTR